MTYRTFLRQLRAVKAKWSVAPEGFIRCARGMCPIEAVAHQSLPKIGAGDYRAAIDHLGLGERLFNRIMDAADEAAHHDRATRRTLLTLTKRRKFATTGARTR